MKLTKYIFIGTLLYLFLFLIDYFVTLFSIDESGVYESKIRLGDWYDNEWGRIIHHVFSDPPSPAHLHFMVDTRMHMLLYHSEIKE